MAEDLLAQLTGADRVGIALEALLEALPGTIVVVDDHGRIAFAEASLRELGGHEPADLVGRDVEVLLPPGQRDAHRSERDAYLEAPRSRAMGAPLDTVLRHRDGHDVPVEISLSPVEVQGRRFVVAAVRDASERREVIAATRRALERERAASAQLRHVAQAKNAFIRAVSHELRTPLTVLQGLATTLEEWLPSMPEAQVADIAHRIARNARRLDQLLSDLLDVDRLTRGVVEANRRHLDVIDLTRRVLERSDLDETRVHLEGPDHLEAEVDAAQVERILENLLSNAAKHGGVDSEVMVRWEPVDDAGGVLLCVEDDGPGVDEAHRDAIFEPFTQADPDAHHAPGTGVGLSLVAEFARLHGGRAWVEDRPSGGGSSFRVLLPPPPRDDDDAVVHLP